MKTARWYFTHGGRKILADTKAEIHSLALAVADRTGRPVTVRKVRPPAAGKPKPRTMKANPLNTYYSALALGQQRSKEMHAPSEAAHKGRKLAKILQGVNRGGTGKRKEAAAVKSGKFAVDVRIGREAYTLYRPSRSGADQLADQLQAAGHKVVIREV